MPFLPPETWRLIFAHATFVLGAFDTHIINGALDHAQRQYDQEERYIVALKDKLAITLVCKAWRALGIEYLYNDVRFGSNRSAGERIHPLAVAFIDSERNDHGGNGLGRASGHGRSFGWWTKRVDVGRYIVDSTHSASALCRLLEHCPRLEIFVVHGTAEWNSHHEPLQYLAEVFRESLQSTLQSLSFHHTGDIRPSVVQDFCAHPNLQTLGISFSHTDLHPTPLLQPVILPNITTLNIFATFGLERDIANWTFPALRHLSVLRCYPEDFPLLIPFFTTHGPQLYSLTLAEPVREGQNDIAEFADISTLLLLCPNVTEFIYDVVNFPEFTLSPPHDATHLGLRWFDPHYRFHVQNVHPLLDALTASFPKLQCIRLLDQVLPCEIPFIGTGAEVEWKRIIDHWEARGVKFEDLYGNQVTESAMIG